MTYLLETRGLSRQFSDWGVGSYAVCEVSLRLPPGAFIALMGASGSGKSTLLHLLGGLDRPSAGEIYLQGERVDQLSEQAWASLRRTHVSFVFQAFHLLGNLTAAGNIELPALIAGCSPSEARRRRSALLERLGLSDKADAFPSRLSGGQQQRVALARALITRPLLLLADEPTGNLDSATTREVLALLAELNRAGQTIFMVTHDPAVASVAHHIITMRDGRVEGLS